MSEQKYKELNVGDVRQEGDQARKRNGGDRWFETPWHGRPITRSDIEVYEYRRPITEPNNGFPAGLSELPEPPKDHKWEYRGMGWNVPLSTIHLVLYPTDDGFESYWTPRDGLAGNGWDTCHYAEAVKLTTEPDYSDPAYQRSVEQAFRDGKRIQVQSNSTKIWYDFGIMPPSWSWGSSNYRVHPDDANKEKDWTTPEAQAEFRLKWAADPTIPRDDFNSPRNEWRECHHEHWLSGHLYRPRQQPKEKSQFELDNESFSQWFESRDKEKNPHPDYIDCWLAALAYARQPNNAA